MIRIISFSILGRRPLLHNINVQNTHRTKPDFKIQYYIPLPHTNLVLYFFTWQKKAIIQNLDTQKIIETVEHVYMPIRNNLLVISITAKLSLIIWFYCKQVISGTQLISASHLTKFIFDFNTFLVQFSDPKISQETTGQRYENGT